MHGLAVTDAPVAIGGSSADDVSDEEAEIGVHSRADGYRPLAVDTVRLCAVEASLLLPSHPDRHYLTNLIFHVRYLSLRWLTDKQHLVIGGGKSPYVCPNLELVSCGQGPRRNRHTLSAP